MTAYLAEETPGKNWGATTIKFVLFLGLGLFISWLTLRGLSQSEKQQILNSFRIANYNWVILAVLLGILSHVLRALRWRLFLEPLGYHPSLKTTFFAVMVGYFANMAFPRLGEVTRCGILAKYEKIPFNRSFGTVITERAIDMFLFFALFVLMVFTQVGTIDRYLDTNIYPKLAEKFANPLFSRMFFFFSAALVIGFVLILVMLRKKIAASVIFKKIVKLALGFWEGIKSLSQVKKPGLFIFYSLAIWVLYFLMLYVCFFCFSETTRLSPGAGLSSLVLGSIGIMVTPGGIGLYPAIIQETLILYGIAKTTGLALGWIAWTAQTSMILFVGGASLILLSFNKQFNGKA